MFCFLYCSPAATRLSSAARCHLPPRKTSRPCHYSPSLRDKRKSKHDDSQNRGVGEDDPRQGRQNREVKHCSCGTGVSMHLVIYIRFWTSMYMYALYVLVVGRKLSYFSLSLIRTCTHIHSHQFPITHPFMFIPKTYQSSTRHF